MLEYSLSISAIVEMLKLCFMFFLTFVLLWYLVVTAGKHENKILKTTLKKALL